MNKEIKFDEAIQTVYGGKVEDKITVDVSGGGLEIASSTLNNKNTVARKSYKEYVNYPPQGFGQQPLEYEDKDNYRILNVFEVLYKLAIKEAAAEYYADEEDIAIGDFVCELIFEEDSEIIIKTIVVSYVAYVNGLKVNGE